MTTLQTLQFEIVRKLSFYRAAERTVKSGEFKVAWKSATPEERQRFEYHIKRLSKEGITQWLSRQQLKDKGLEAWPVKKLRLMGRDLKVKDYHRLRKTQLIWKIQEKLDEEALDAATDKESRSSRTEESTDNRSDECDGNSTRPDTNSTGSDH